MRHVFTSLILALICGACGSSDEADVREAAERLQKAIGDRDYAAAWEYMDEEARGNLTKQLTDFRKLEKTSPLYGPMWAQFKEQMGLKPEDLGGLDTRGYFIAMFEGMDRAQPDLRRQQTEQTRSSKITEVTVDGDRATVKTRLTSGAVEQDQWVKEDGSWRIKARSVGDGITR